jgi:hypothetical protein
MTHAEPQAQNAEQPDSLTTDRPAGLSARRLSDQDAHQPQDGPSTEQIARAGEAPAEPGGATGPAQTTEQALARSRQGSEGDRTPLLEPHDLERIVDRWREIQASFVDEPAKAVKDADTLVAELMQQLARMFASQREQLEATWSAGDSVSTEDLRQGLQRYRSFFERLLAV